MRLQLANRHLPLGYYLVAAIAGTAIACFGFSLSAKAQTCTPLKVVGSKQIGTVEKTVSPPSTGITRSNWDTDFAISNPARYQYYLTTINSKESGDYSIEMFLKYPDGNADNFYSREIVDLDQGDSLMIRGESRPTQKPYQVNVKVGGIGALGDTYTISTYGCRA